MVKTIETRAIISAQDKIPLMGATVAMQLTTIARCNAVMRRLPGGLHSAAFMRAARIANEIAVAIRSAAPNSSVKG